MKKDKNNLVKFETPEKPRAKSSGNSKLKESIEKAKKYDELMRVIEQDQDMCSKALKDLKENKSFIRLGYVNGYTDGKIAGYEYIVECLLQKYLEG